MRSLIASWEKVVPRNLWFTASEVCIYTRMTSASLALFGLGEHRKE